jgi:hypothetical protein
MAYKQRKRTVVSESVYFNGIEFRRYPNAKNWSDQVYFRPGGSDVARGVEALHREIWKSLHGPIPQGYHIHHKDTNPLNNTPENLVCVPSDAHQAEHGDKTKTDSYKRQRRTVLDRVRDKATAWHRSEEGRAWHREHGKDGWKDRESVTRICEYCKKEYQTLITGDGSRFCSNNCKVQARRVSGVDNERRVCTWCGKAFMVNRYSKTKTCSLSCAASWRNSKRE